MLALAADLHAAILKKLSMYVLRAKVKLTDASTNQVMLGLSGPAVFQALQAIGLHDVPAAPMQTCQFSAGTVIHLGNERYWLITEAAMAPKLWQTLAQSLQVAGLDAWNWQEITAGLAQVTLATREEFVPQMINFELIGGVSFKKGCYPGQEIVARSQYLGKIKRRSYRLHVANSPQRPAAGRPVFTATEADQACGMVINAAPSPRGGFDILAMLQKSAAETEELHLNASTGPLALIQPLPYSLD